MIINRSFSAAPALRVSARVVLLSTLAGAQGACAWDVRPGSGGASATAVDPCLTDSGYTLAPIANFENMKASPPAFTVNDAGGIDSSPWLTKGASSVVAARCGGAAEHIVTTVTGWGRQYYLSFASTASGAFDASAYEGISFWVRRGGSGEAVVAFLTDTYTDDSDAKATAALPGGQAYCNSSAATDSGKCDPFIDAVGLEPDWRFVAIPFDRMNQKGYGVRAPTLDSSNVHAVGIQLDAQDWDFWIDDFAFYRAPGH